MFSRATGIAFEAADASWGGPESICDIRLVRLRLAYVEFQGLTNRRLLRCAWARNIADVRL